MSKVQNLQQAVLDSKDEIENINVSINVLKMELLKLETKLVGARFVARKNESDLRIALKEEGNID